MDSQNFVSLIKNKRCFKGTGSCIDLILTNRKYSFKNVSSYETRLIDHHHLIYLVMKATFKCGESKKLIYRDYSNFYQKDFQSDLLLNIGDGKNYYLEFEKNFVELLDKHAPKKIKFFEGNLSSTLIKHQKKLLWNVLNLKIGRPKRKTVKIFQSIKTNVIMWLN